MNEHVSEDEFNTDGGTDSISPSAPREPEVINLQESLYKWFSDNKTDEKFSIWKSTDADCNLYIALRNSEGEAVVTFKYEGIATTPYMVWTACERHFATISMKEIGICSFVMHHEVSCNDPENAQRQMFVVINRTKHPAFPDTIKDVVKAYGQYQNADWILNYRLKANNIYEEEDIEKCFQQALLVLADEAIVDVPADVVYAAGHIQGSGIWAIIGKTYYCHY